VRLVDRGLHFAGKFQIDCHDWSFASGARS
jgi:hypothetical protein